MRTDNTHACAAASYLMNIRYRPSDDDESITFTDIANKDNDHLNHPPGANSFDLKQSSHLLRHSFPKGPTWTPERMEINGRKGRRAVCVLAQDNLHYRIYDLDSATSDDETIESTSDEKDEEAMEVDDN